MKRVWLLNFDADEELAGHQAPRAAAAAIQAKLTQAVSALVGTDALFDGSATSTPHGAAPKAIEARDGESVVGYTFMPTPRAIARLAAAGVHVHPAPTLEVLRAANSRELSAGLGVALPDATYVVTEAAALGVLASPSVSGSWVLKRRFGFAGRGGKRMVAGEISEDVHAFVRNALRHGGVEIAPWVTRLADFGLHGFLHRNGRLEHGSPTLQHCDKFGQWERTTRTEPNDLREDERTALTTALGEAATALHELGYFGPFGIDAFRYVLPDGSEHFCPRCEINARYTMGWAVGMGDLRPDLAALSVP